MKDKIFGVLQRVGRSFMLPIAILPVAGLLLGIGSSFTNETMLQAYGLWDVMGPGTLIYTILSVCSECGNVVFGNLPIIFAMGVAIGMARAEKEVAALSAAIAFFIMHTGTATMITVSGGAEAMPDGAVTSVLGIQSLQMGVFGGIIVGLGVAALHNKFYKIQLPEVLSFFGGTRFVPIISSLVYMIVGILMFYIWPPVQNAMYALGALVQNSGYPGTWLYGLIERALIPFGLHHVFYLPFWQTSVGGTMEVAGKVIEGAQNIFFAQLGDPSCTEFAVSATRFMSGKFPLMIFGLPGAALAMYRCAKPEKKKAVGGLLLSAALTSMLTGITEPLEFTFLFVAPILYVIHCVFAGLAYMLMHICGVGVGMTFSGGFIDLFLFGILQGNSKSHWIWVVIVGIVYFFVYYFLFSFLIKKMNLKTPGREDDDEETKLYTRADVNAKKSGNASGSDSDAGNEFLSIMITKGLGGKANISDVDCCITRLRCTVHDASKVSDTILKQTGAKGVIQKGTGVQIVYGPTVTVIKSDLEYFLTTKKSDEITADYDLSGDAAPVDASAKTIEETKTDSAQPTEEKAVLSPIKGTILPLSEVADAVFSSEMLGKGFAVEPSEGKTFAPISGTISAVFDTKHAIGMTGDNGVEVLVHMGLDTVKLGGQGFDVKVKVGDHVNAGDLMATFDIDFIKKEGYAVTTPVVISNTDSFAEVSAPATGDANVGDTIVTVK
jgi:PTS system D-glucosamine-specific IIC component